MKCRVERHCGRGCGGRRSSWLSCSPIRLQYAYVREAMTSGLDGPDARPDRWAQWCEAWCRRGKRPVGPGDAAIEVEAAARGDAPESKPAASAVPEEERLAKPSDEIGRAPAGNETNRTMAPAGNETNRTDTTEESVTGGEDSSPRGEGEASPTESIEDLEAEDLRPVMDAAEARAKQARKPTSSSGLLTKPEKSLAAACANEVNRH